MTAATRSDVHRLAELDPADYRLLAYEHDGGDGEQDFEWTLDEWRGFDLRDDSTDDHFIALADALAGDRYRCSLCGHSHSKTWAYFEHLPTGEVVCVGHICAGKFRLEGRDDVIALLKDRATGRKLARVRGHFLAGDPRARQAVDRIFGYYADEREAYEADPLAADNGFRYDGFLHDLALKFERYAELSTKQIEAAWWAAERRTQFAIADDLRDQERAAERESAEPVPVTEDRIQVTGEIVKTDTKENDYGTRFVMVVKDERGFLLWGTQPDTIGDAEKGDQVRFMARVEPSDRDEYFGFFNRPTKAEIVVPSIDEEDDDEGEFEMFPTTTKEEK